MQRGETMDHNERVDDETKTRCIDHKNMYEMVKEIFKQNGEVHACLLGDYKEQGLISRVKDLEKWRDEKIKSDRAILRSVYAFVGTAIIGVGGFLWAILTHTVAIVKP
jgi:hypothetical protein